MRGLVPLLLVLRQLSKQTGEQDAAARLRRFSSAGQVMVVLAVCTGVVNTGLILGRLPLEWSQPYQLLLAAKICLVAGMIGIALVNRYVVAPRSNPDFRPAAKLLGYTASIELMLGAGALMLVNLIGTLDPV